MFEDDNQGLLRSGSFLYLSVVSGVSGDGRDTSAGNRARRRRPRRGGLHGLQPRLRPSPSPPHAPFPPASSIPGPVFPCIPSPGLLPTLLLPGAPGWKSAVGTQVLAARPLQP